jgi:hydroxymethylbilane synthase
LSGLRIGTRGSALALAQARPVAAALGGELVVVRTGGDRGTAPPGDKSRWVADLERALLEGGLDLAVHSAKDVPQELPDGLALLAAAGPRADPRDALCGAPSLTALPPGARVGTSSLRRGAQLHAAREDLDVVPMRGNVDTRLRRLADGEWDAIVLAAAGLERLGRGGDGMLDAVPAPGQGVIVVEGRVGDERAGPVADAVVTRALAAERGVARTLGASCRTPFGALAEREERGLRLRTWLGLPDGSAWLADEVTGHEPEALGAEAARRLLAAGARELLDEAERVAAAG